MGEKVRKRSFGFFLTLLNLIIWRINSNHEEGIRLKFNKFIKLIKSRIAEQLNFAGEAERRNRRACRQRPTDGSSCSSPGMRRIQQEYQHEQARLVSQRELLSPHHPQSPRSTGEYFVASMEIFSRPLLCKKGRKNKILITSRSQFWFTIILVDDSGF